MNKNLKNNIISLIVLASYIGALILAATIINKSNFVPDISYCTSYPNFLCENPITRHIFVFTSLRFWAVITLYALLCLIVSLILKFIGLLPLKFERGGNAKQQTRYGWIAALIWTPIFLLLLILYAD